MGRVIANTSRILAAAFIALVIALACTSPDSIPIPPYSDTYDCDDAALAMYNYFQDRGIEATPFIGNLKMDGEAYADSNHVWVLVRSGGREIAYDWGTPRLDRQHYEGYEISLEQLLAAVAQDRQGSDGLASSGQ
jgi:hypothetical protein